MTKDEEIADLRIKLAQTQDELDAVKYELDSWRDTFHLAADEELKKHGSLIINIWLKCLGGFCAPKSHLIDGLAITTRRLRSLDFEPFCIHARAGRFLVDARRLALL
jgi:hypothetical protein